MRLVTSFGWVLLLAAWCQVAGADPEPKPVIEGLQNPFAVAVRPETDEVFISESGAGRVVRLVGGNPVEVVGGFGKEKWGQTPAYDIGPLGLCFLDKNTLLVGSGDQPAGEDALRVFDLAKLESAPLKLEEAKVTLKLPAGEGAPGEGNFFAVVALKEAVLVTCQGDEAKGWVARAARDGGNVSSFVRYLPTREAVPVKSPLAMTLSPKGYLVVAQMGADNTAGDSLLTFYNPKTKKLVLQHPTGLFDISGLAYSPKTGHLYATDFRWLAPGEGGLFRLQATKTGAVLGLEAKKLAPLDKPTALAFDKEGSLLVTVLGSGEKGGKLLKFEPGL